MKEEDKIQELFDRLQNDFDFESPEQNHQERFLEKLNTQKGIVNISKKKRNWLKPLSIAASVVLVAVLGFQFFVNQPSIKEQVVEISPEATKTEFYFASLIEEQVELLKNEKSPETAKLVEDTLLQLKKLEGDYQKLERELLLGENNKIILSAMITNFQTRIDLLKEVLNNIEEIKNLKSQNDEKFTI